MIYGCIVQPRSSVRVPRSWLQIRDRRDSGQQALPARTGCRRAYRRSPRPHLRAGCRAGPPPRPARI